MPSSKQKLAPDDFLFVVFLKYTACTIVCFVLNVYERTKTSSYALSSAVK